MQKRIHAAEDVAKWKKSPAYSLLTSFYLKFNEELAVSENLSVCQATDNALLNDLLQLLNSLIALTDKHPCVSHSRFGNLAFRDWHTEACTVIESRISQLCASYVPASIPEGLSNTDTLVEETIKILATYLIESLGNSTRIDYGTGHEMNFIIFLFVLSLLYSNGSMQLTFVDSLLLLTKYFELVRWLIKFYKLEPAGSHGVWGLDDYQFMPFLLGSGQLRKQTAILPSEATRPDFPRGFLFFEGIAFIRQYKSGPFSEHSRILYEICTTLSWPQINQGLLKMYRAEVMDKFPVVQHLYFCKFFPFE